MSNETYPGLQKNEIFGVVSDCKRVCYFYTDKVGFNFVGKGRYTKNRKYFKLATRKFKIIWVNKVN